MTNKQMNVLQLIDSLSVGGAERMSINIANGLATSKKVNSFIVSSRKNGSLKKFISKDVTYFCLNKRSFFDLKAMKSLFRFISKNDISVIHAHSYSIFWALIMKHFKPKIQIIWHDHYGIPEKPELKRKVFLILRFFKHNIQHVIVVTSDLKNWMTDILKIKVKNISYVNNFASLSKEKDVLKPKVPGVNGKRIVCLANLRSQKDHFFLINIASKICKEFPDWTFICIGTDFNDEYSQTVKSAIQKNGIADNIFLLGNRTDILPLLKACQIGILTSRTEGLPVALLEYGIAGLPTVCTNTGQCSVVLNEPKLIIKHGDVESYTRILKEFIQNRKLREEMGIRFKHRVQAEFSEETVIKKLVDIYNNTI